MLHKKKNLSWGYNENHYDVFFSENFLLLFLYFCSSEQKKEEFHVCFYVNVHSSKMHLNEQVLFLVKVLRGIKKTNRKLSKVLKYLQEVLFQNIVLKI